MVRPKTTGAKEQLRTPERMIARIRQFDWVRVQGRVDAVQARVRAQELHRLAYELVGVKGHSLQLPQANEVLETSNDLTGPDRLIAHLRNDAFGSWPFVAAIRLENTPARLNIGGDRR